MADRAFGDKVMQKMVESTSMGWFDGDTAKYTVKQCLQFSKKLIDSLMDDNLKEMGVKDKGQTLAYIGKMLDQIARLTNFSEGKADSRQELTVASLLPLLNDDELAIFNRAVERLEAAQATGAKPPSQLH